MSPLSVVAIVPARGGSKGIPRKNLQQLGGMPLIEWPIRVALRAARVSRVIVSTDDAEIAMVAGRCGVEVMRRPSSLALDETTTLAVLQQVLADLDAQGRSPEAIVLLEPTSPFRTPEIVDACLEKLAVDGVRTCITVTQLERNPYNIFSVAGDSAERFIRVPEGGFGRRQEFTHLKRLNGCVYAVRSSNIREGRLIQNPIRVVEMRGEDSINIDTPLDLEIARLILGRGMTDALNAIRD